MSGEDRGAVAAGVGLWVLVAGGLVYGIVNTFKAVLELL